MAGIRASKKEKPCKVDTKCSRYLSSLKQGQPLGISDLQDMFVAYARRNRLTNVRELVNFTQRVDKNLKNIHNENDQMNIHLERISVDSEADKSGFINQVKNSCPYSVY